MLGVRADEGNGCCLRDRLERREGVVLKNKRNSPSMLGQALLKWYDIHARQLPWRAQSGVLPDPYHVWLSEIMLQQTTVVTVIPYFTAFVARWPTVARLAEADLDDVLHAWQGLGYYARARNLHKCAVKVTRELAGAFPQTESGLLTLPGIGPYTAAAIAAIAFRRPAVAVDGNVERVICRLHALDQPAKTIRPEISQRAREMMVPGRSGDFAQAMMDLGATVCRPAVAACDRCPWQQGCKSAASECWRGYPVKLAKPGRPVRHGAVFWLVRPDGAVYLRRRPDKGLLGGMTEIPSSDWREQNWPVKEALAQAPVGCNWRRLSGEVTHTFTHFHLRLQVFSGRCDDGGPNDGFWSTPDRFADHALPTLMKKVARHVLTRDI